MQEDKLHVTIDLILNGGFIEKMKITISIESNPSSPTESIDINKYLHIYHYAIMQFYTVHGSKK